MEDDSKSDSMDSPKQKEFCLRCDQSEGAESSSAKRRMKDEEQTSSCRSGDAVGIDAVDSTVNIATSFAELRDAKLQEKIAFVQAIARRQDVIFGDGVNYSTKAKEEAWREVAKEVEGMGLKSFIGKTWTRLRDHDWQYVRRHALARCENNYRPSGKLGDLDRLVLTIISNFNSRLSTDHYSEPPPYDMAFDDLELTNESPEMKTEPGCSVETNVLSRCFDESARSQVAERLSDQSSSAQSGNCSETGCAHFQSTKSERVASTPLLPQRGVCSNSSFLSPVERNPRNRVHSSTQNFSDVGDRADSVRYFPAKRPRTGDGTSGDDHNLRDNSEFLYRKQQLELRRMELENEKLETEIQHLINQEKRARELHGIELRRARFQLVMMGADLLQEPQRDE
ncbi:hypothetical protein V3C99_010660 [Haemonchus contortus]